MAGGLLSLLLLTLGANAQAQAAKKPNVLIIWGDDIGGFNQ